MFQAIAELDGAKCVALGQRERFAGIQRRFVEQQSAAFATPPSDRLGRASHRA